MHERPERQGNEKQQKRIVATFVASKDSKLQACQQCGTHHKWPLLAKPGLNQQRGRDHQSDNGAPPRRHLPEAESDERKRQEVEQDLEHAQYAYDPTCTIRLVKMTSAMPFMNSHGLPTMVYAKGSVVGSAWCSTIHRPVAICHQTS